jgi:uncharacterized protein (TIGR00251 family)
MIFKVRVIPNSRKTEIVDRAPGFLKIKLAAQAVDGKANKALIKFLAQELNLPPSAITISKGQRGKDKVIMTVYRHNIPKNYQDLALVIASVREAISFLLK